MKRIRFLLSSLWIRDENVAVSPHQCLLASLRLDTEGIDLLCALLQVGPQSPVTPADLRDF